jgi:superoxide dismutase, Fe-Mn family
MNVQGIAMRRHDPRRRQIVAAAGALLVGSALGMLAAPRTARGQGGPLQLMKLPYAENALEPVISARTIGFHYGKHHASYVTTANKMLENNPLASQPLPEIVKTAAADPSKASLFNNVGQVWNHDFYWQSLKPSGGGKPSGRVGDLIGKSFGDYEKFKAALAAAAMGQFGSGWAWLCQEGDKLTIRRTPNAETPLTVAGVRPLLTIDVWEHAYYLDYQNRRADYVDAVIDKLLNWEFAEKNLG